MSWNEWAYDAGQATPAELVSVQWREISAKVGASYGANFYTDGALADLNAEDVYPVQRTGTAPDQWYVRDEANDVVVYAAGPDGVLYEITQAFREMTYEEARKQARAILTQYFRDYDTSVFTIQGQTFSAASEQTIQYFKLAAWVSGWPNGNPPAEPYDPPQVVIDVDGDANAFTLASEFYAFWNRFESLNQEARTVTYTAWKDVQAATTTDEVRQIIAALPPIPGSV